MKMINVLYEDNHIIVVVKECNVPVCEDSSKDKDLLTMIKEYLKENIKELQRLSTNQLINKRYEKYRKIGQVF